MAQLNDFRERWFKRYRLVLREEQSYKERWQMTVNRLGLAAASGALLVTIAGVTYLIVAWTPLREYIVPGYVSEASRMRAIDAELSRLSRNRAPVIAAVNGTAAGAGFSLAMAADLAIAEEQAVFTMAYTNAGLSPDGSSTYFMPRKIGDRRTRELMLTNRLLTAPEALDWGVVNQVVEGGGALAAARVMATGMAQGPTEAYAQVKRLLDSSFSQSLETQMELEARAIADQVASVDGQEGMLAFVEKRKPQFRGV